MATLSIAGAAQEELSKPLIRPGISQISGGPPAASSSAGFKDQPQCPPTARLLRSPRRLSRCCVGDLTDTFMIEERDFAIGRHMNGGSASQIESFRMFHLKSRTANQLDGERAKRCAALEGAKREIKVFGSHTRSILQPRLAIQLLISFFRPNVGIGVL